MAITRLNPNPVKSITKNLTSNGWGNFPLGMKHTDGIVIGVVCPNSSYNLVPFMNANGGTWFAYGFLNRTGTTPEYVGNNVTVNNCTIYYV